MSDEQDQPASAGPGPKQGDEPAMGTEAEKSRAIEMAFDYRGDVTVHTHGGEQVEGYVYDRRSDGVNACVRLLCGTDRVTVKRDDIVRIVFTGRDTAAGKSWETWVKKYQEKKAKGEAANIEAEELE